MLSISTKEMMTRAESQDNCLRTAPSLQPINVKMVVKLSGFYDYSIILLFPHKLTESNIDLNHYQNSVIITDLDCYVYKICWLVSHSQPRILTFFILITNWSVSTINTIWQYLLYGLWRTIEHSLYVIRNLIECGSIHPLLGDVTKILINWLIGVQGFWCEPPSLGQSFRFIKNIKRVKTFPMVRILEPNDTTTAVTATTTTTTTTLCSLPTFNWLSNGI